MDTPQVKVIAESSFLLRSNPTQSRTAAVCKRGIDLTLALISLLIAAPLMVITSFLLWCESSGHVIFRQQRLGLHGKCFTLYKFRKFPASWGSQGSAVTVANDVRLTKIGAVLERTKLDELPQLWNVIKGDMSFVGLRPETLEFADLFVGRYRELLNHRPGFFGPGLIRRECDLYPPDEDPEAYYRRVLFPFKAKRFLAYYKTANVFTDLICIVKGLWTTIEGTVNWRRVIRSYGPIISVDIVLVWIGWTLVNFFRYLNLWWSDSFVAGLWIFPGIFITCALVGGCYHYPRRHFSPSDGIRLVVVSSFAWMAGFLVLVGITRSVSLYLMPMGWFVVCTLLIIGRTVFSMGGTTARHRQRGQSPGVLIYGFNRGGIALAIWMRARSPEIRLLGFLTDDREQVGQRAHGVRIIGSERDLPTIRSAYQVEEIWMTFSPDNTKRHRLRTFCQQHDIRLVVFPELEPFRRFVTSECEVGVRCETGTAEQLRPEL